MNGRTRTLAIALAVILVLVIAGVAYVVTRPTGSTAPSGISGPPPPTCQTNDWTMYHGDVTHSGYLLTPSYTSVVPAWSHPVQLDGQVYAQPLTCNGSVFVATENDTVYKVNATSGDVLWHTHLGTPVVGSSLPCGDIDPSGITGTPVIDPTNGVLYAVTFLAGPVHVLFGLYLTNGSVASKTVVDPAGADPSVEQQRGALAFFGGFVYIPYGGLAGDCGDYHGWVVGVATDGEPGIISYQVQSSREAGIWSPSGISVDGNGDLFVSTGNGASSTSFDYGSSVLELSPGLKLLGYFAPYNWAQLNVDDTDLGSVAPTVLPNDEIFQIGKAGVGYLLTGQALGGISTPLYNASICPGAYAGTAHIAFTIFVSCNNGIYAVNASSNQLSVLWSNSTFTAGAPIVIGNVVWAIDTSGGNLDGFSLTTGASLYSLSLGSVDHFVTPCASGGAIYVGAGDQLISYSYH